MPEATIVIPCYNEADRLDPDAFVRFIAEHPEVRFLFVNDGSTDDTAAVIQRVIDRSPERCSVCTLRRNMGKAEAVRRGFLQAFETDARLVGLWDADLATPLEAIPVLCETLSRRCELQMVFGSRVRMLGRDIKRRAVRHYAGRVFATLVSLMLGLAIYDTQCGAKLFRASPTVKRIFGEPFVARWVFDVEIIARFIRDFDPERSGRAAQLIYEYPLPVWHGVRGSKLRLYDFARAALDLLRIHRRYLIR